MDWLLLDQKQKHGLTTPWYSLMADSNQIIYIYGFLIYIYIYIYMYIIYWYLLYPPWNKQQKHLKHWGRFRWVSFWGPGLATAAVGYVRHLALRMLWWMNFRRRLNFPKTTWVFVVSWIRWFFQTPPMWTLRPAIFQEQFPNFKFSVKEIWKMSSWWFWIFFIFIPTWGNDSIWLIFLRWVETTS